MPDPRVAELLGARRRRISLIRGRVLALAVALFLAISAGITVQLVTGHDPALAGAAARTAGGGSTGTSRPGGSASGSQGTSSGSQNSSSGSISPVSTSSS